MIIVDRNSTINKKLRTLISGRSGIEICEMCIRDRAGRASDSGTGAEGGASHKDYQIFRA